LRAALSSLMMRMAQQDEGKIKSEPCSQPGGRFKSIPARRKSRRHQTHHEKSQPVDVGPAAMARSGVAISEYRYDTGFGRKALCLATEHYGSLWASCVISKSAE